MKILSIKKIIQNQLAILFIFFPLFSNQIFFLALGLFGYSNNEDEQSLGYIIYTSSVFLVSIFGFAGIGAFGRFKRSEIIFLLFYSAFIVFSILSSLLSSYNFKAKEFFLFILFSTPGIVSAFLFHRFFVFQKLHAFFFLIVTLSIFLLFGFVRSFLSAELFADILLGGASYQFISYLASFLFGFCLAFLKFSSIYSLFRFQGLRKTILIVLCLVLPIVVIATGSKGAFLLTLIYSMLYLLSSFVRQPIKFSLGVVVAVPLLVCSIYIFNGSDTQLDGLNRILVLFDSDTNVDKKTSGRIEYYQNFVYLIQDSPLTGEGFFIDNGYVTNSHNFVTMIIMNFGLILGALFIALNLVLLFFYYISPSVDKLKRHFFYVIFLFCSVNLMFSGSYLKNPFYWFCFTTLVLFFIEQKNRMSNHFCENKF